MKPESFLIPALLITATLAIVSCSKSGSGSKPTLKLQSINTTVQVGGNLNALFSFSTSSADLSQGTFVAIRNRLNQIPLPPGTQNTDTLTGVVPQFPSVTKGQFQYSLPYSYLHESDVENDTIVFKFAVVDPAGISSDTLTTPQIVVLFQ
jgi:hypothetical protein